MQKWVSVKDKKPIQGEYVLFCGNDEKFVSTKFGFYSGDTFYPYTTNHLTTFEQKDITHWMPLPEVPK